MDLGSKTIAIYYHMPFIVHEDGEFYANPVMGTFIESLIPYFKKILVYGFESINNSESITYNISHIKNMKFVSLGAEGQFWDYFSKMHRMRYAIKHNKNPIDILLLRVPSHKAYAVWKYLDKPKLTALLLIGNKYFNAGNISYGFLRTHFHLYRSNLNDKQLRKICSSGNTLAIANSDSIVKIFCEDLGVKIELVHTSSISVNDIVKKCNKRFGNIQKRLLFVGRVCYEKGIHELFEALKMLNRKNKGKFILDIAGPLGDLGGNDVNQLIQQYNISEYVKYHGVVPFGKTLFKFYRNADAYILPSYHEGMPKTVWEAMSQGTPVIASEIDGMKDNFTNYEDIIFIEPRNPKSIVDAILKLNNSQKLVKKLQRNGHKRAKNITRENQAERVVELFMAYPRDMRVGYKHQHSCKI